MSTVYDQLVAAGAPAIKPPFGYNIEADTDRYLRVQVVMLVSKQVRMMSQRVVNLAGTSTADTLNALAAAAAQCWDEIEGTAGLDAIIGAVIGMHSLTGSRAAAPLPTQSVATTTDTTDASGRHIAVVAAPAVDPH